MKIYEEYANRNIEISDSFENEYNSINELWRKELDSLYIKLEE